MTKTGIHFFWFFALAGMISAEIKSTIYIDNSFDFSQIMQSELHYCISDLNLLQQGMKAYDKDNLEYLIMRKSVLRQFETRKIEWAEVDSNLTRRFTIGIKNYKGNSLDSLPYAAWDYAVSQNIKYVVVFYGYSLLEKQGVTPNDVATSIALSGLGILLGSVTGTYIITYPTGKSTSSVMDLYCAIFSIDSNKCIFRTKASITNYNNSSTLETEINRLYETVFNKLYKAIMIRK